MRAALTFPRAWTRRFQMGVLHRDIKPENFLLSGSGHGAIVKLADFGMACFYRRGIPEKEAVGSPFYMAPEMVTRGSGGYGPAADVWSCGVILYRFLSATLPFPGDTAAEIFHALRNKVLDYNTPAWRLVSPAARHLMRRLLEKDPSKRIDGQDVLTHAWMTQHQPNGASPGLNSAMNSSEGLHVVPTATSPGPPHAGSTGSSAAMPQLFYVPPAQLQAQIDPGTVTQSGPEPSPTAADLPRSVNRVGDQVPSARVFFLPGGARRCLIQGFLDCFREVENTYRDLLQAADAEDAARHWGDVCKGFQALDRYLVEYASHDGNFFLGKESSIAEAATAPALYRIVSTLPVLRGIQLIPACEDRGLARLAAWLKEVLTHPSEVCDVDCLPPDEYVSLARKVHGMHVRLTPHSCDSAMDLTHRLKPSS